ncbi:MAG TPA: hypothetical protein EYH19_07610, partial [Desulfocapsa sulfexigens]|nr:hypothetical protein [Desulfocapsa sulfexigens]
MPSRKKQRAGIVGVPPLSVMELLATPEFEIFDLDEPQGKIDIETASPFLPRVYCGILRTVISNSLAIQPDIIYIDTGSGKCDCAVHTATVLEDILPNCRIEKTRNNDSADFGNPLCRTRMNLADKMAAITASVQNPLPYKALKACNPTAGFWGVPPRDFSLLKFFPDTTHIYGWTRCMEN